MIGKEFIYLAERKKYTLCDYYGEIDACFKHLVDLHSVIIVMYLWLSHLSMIQSE